MFDMDSFQKSYESSVPLHIFSPFFLPFYFIVLVSVIFFRNGFSGEDAELYTSLRFDKLQTTVRTQI